MFIKGEIQPGMIEKLENSDSEISSNIITFEPVSKSARCVQYCIRKDLGVVELAAVLPLNRTCI